MTPEPKNYLPGIYIVRRHEGAVHIEECIAGRWYMVAVFEGKPEPDGEVIRGPLDLDLMAAQTGAVVDDLLCLTQAGLVKIAAQKRLNAELLEACEKLANRLAAVSEEAAQREWVENWNVIESARTVMLKAKGES